MDHAEERRQCEDEWRLLHKTVVSPVVAGAGAQLGVGEQEVAAVLGRLHVNMARSAQIFLYYDINYFYLTTSWRLGDTAGRALYPTLSLVSHSCVANSRYQGEHWARTIIQM